MLRYLFLVVIFLPLSASARGGVVLYDATGGGWPIAEVASDYTSHGYPLVVQDAGRQSCKQAKNNAPSGTIPICEKDLAGWSVGWTTWGKGGPPVIWLDPEAPDKKAAVCHELMHALTHIKDNYGANPDSCVWGWLDHLGGFDIQYLADHYRKPPRS